jgi:hypothetical protein
MVMKNTPGEPAERPDYLSYLLRLWQADGEGESQRTEVAWRASIESAQTGATASFADLEDLFVFLREQTGRTAEAGQEKNKDEDEGATTVILVIHRAGRRQGGN